MSAYDFNYTGDFSEDVCARFVATDRYIGECVVPQDAALESALAANAAAGLDNIDVAPNQGKLFQLLARLAGARNILEVGTLGGYSAIWLARALPRGGRLVTLELEPRHARVAEANVAAAGLAGVVDVRVGPALESLRAMGEDEGWGPGRERGPFDMVFIDADKPNNWEYVDRALGLARVGTVIVVDNVGRKGRVADAGFAEGPGGSSVAGTRRMFEMMSKDRRLDTTAIQTVGVKGWDGFALALVVEL